MSIKTQIANLLRKAPIFFPIRFFLILTPPDKKVLEDENYNAYNSKQDIPDSFYTENQKMQVQGATTFERTLYMAKYLKSNYPGGTKSLGYSSAKSLHTIQTLPEGTCGDYSQVFINFCILNDIKVREWGVHDKVYKNKKGHVFNEVFLAEENRWMCIDLHFAIYFRDKTNGQVLSMADIIAKTADYKENEVEIVHFLPVRDSEEGRDYIKSFYFGRDYLYFIVTRYLIKKMDTALDKGGKLPIPLIHLLLIFRGQYYKYMLVFSHKTEKEINPKLRVIFKKYKSLL